MVPGGRNFENLSNLLIYVETKFGDLKNENLCVELEIANATPELWHQEVGNWTRIGFNPTLRREGRPCLRKNIELEFFSLLDHLAISSHPALPLCIGDCGTSLQKRI